MNMLTLIRADGSRAPYVATAEQLMDSATWKAHSAADGLIDATAKTTANLLAGSAERLEELADMMRDPARTRAAAELFARCARELDAVRESHYP